MPNITMYVAFLGDKWSTGQADDFVYMHVRTSAKMNPEARMRVLIDGAGIGDMEKYGKDYLKLKLFGRFGEIPENIEITTTDQWLQELYDGLKAQLTQAIRQEEIAQKTKIPLDTLFTLTTLRERLNSAHEQKKEQSEKLEELFEDYHCSGPAPPQLVTVHKQVRCLEEEIGDLKKQILNLEKQLNYPKRKIEYINNLITLFDTMKELWHLSEKWKDIAARTILLQTMAVTFHTFNHEEQIIAFHDADYIIKDCKKLLPHEDADFAVGLTPETGREYLDYDSGFNDACVIFKTDSWYLGTHSLAQSYISRRLLKKKDSCHDSPVSFMYNHAIDIKVSLSDTIDYLQHKNLPYTCDGWRLEYNNKIIDYHKSRRSTHPAIPLICLLGVTNTAHAIAHNRLFAKRKSETPNPTLLNACRLEEGALNIAVVFADKDAVNAKLKQKAGKQLNNREEALYELLNFHQKQLISVLPEIQRLLSSQQLWQLDIQSFAGLVKTRKMLSEAKEKLKEQGLDTDERSVVVAADTKNLEQQLPPNDVSSQKEDGVGTDNMEVSATPEKVIKPTVLLS